MEEWRSRRLVFRPRRCPLSPASSPIEQRFWGFLPDRELGSCWPWTGQLHKDGYGLISTSRPNKRARLAHRVAYEIMIGPIPDGLNVLHSCDNPPCCNAYEHLFLGTQADNVADCIAKGRESHASVNVGSAHGMAKLDENAVRLIRELAAGGTSGKQLAQDFGVSRATISFVLAGKTWAHVL